MPLLSILAFAAVAACTPPKLCPRRAELGPVAIPQVLPLVVELQEAIKNHEPEFQIDIDSPGGSVGVGLGLLGLMKEAKKQGMVISCRVVEDGTAASMAAIVFLSGCTKRSMAPTASLLFHEPALREVDGGKEGDIRRVADLLADTNKRLAILVAPRLKMTAASYMAWIHDRDRWVSVEEAKAMGALD